MKAVVDSKTSFITEYIIDFYCREGRIFSWRQERTPYRVYLAEILLQRTRAEQVEPVFNYLISKCPDIKLLKKRFEEAKLAMRSLGRTCRLHYLESGLEYIIERYGGEIPVGKTELLSVPGIGDYVASAIRIFGFGVPDTIIDANVVRVFSRLYGLEADGETRRKRSFIEMAARHVPEVMFVEYSYGILDFAALVCRPLDPRCRECGMNIICEYKKKTHGAMSRG